MSNRVELYFPKDLPKLVWPAHYDKRFVKRFFAPMMHTGATHYIKNGNAQLALIKIDQQILPLSINHTEYDNSYVTSLYAYLIYAQEEMERHQMRRLAFFLNPVLKALRWWFKKAQINQVVMVNNYLLSTNLYPSLTQEQVMAIHHFLVKQFATHTILFRSLNECTEKALHQVLTKELAYSSITSRSVYFVHPDSVLSSKKRWINKIDQKLLQKEGIEVLDHDGFNRSDAATIKRLYDLLYLEKYSKLNPQFTEQMLLDTMRSQSLTLLGVKYQGCLVGVAGYFVENRVLTTPIFGYDTALPSSLGLYRMLTALMMQEAKKLGCQYHMSSGVGHFKRQRGGVQYLESMAMYTDHLPKFRRWPWRFLGAVFNYLAKPLLVRYKL